ncbi:dihydrouridine synthase-domain-containing protein, partial [Ochromonadaceae sp. CCMP2298]
MEAQGKTWDSPLIVQLAGDCPETLVAAGQYVHKDVTAVDLNCGCPQRIAKRGNYGAYLLPQTDLLISCLSALVKNLDCPVTVKIRVLPTERETLDLVRRIEDTGVSMLTVHGRLVSQSKLFTGPANWDIIRKIKDTLTIPVVANGGIGCYADALECLRITGADAVMSSEALLENPKLFSESGDEAFRLEFCRAQIGTTSLYAPLFSCVMRGHLFKMLFRFLQADANRDLQKLLSEGSYRQMVGVVALLEERLRGVDFDTERAVERGLCTPAGTGYYMRHR